MPKKSRPHTYVFTIFAGMVAAILSIEIVLRFFNLSKDPFVLRARSLPVVRTDVGGSRILKRSRVLAQSKRNHGMPLEVSEAGFRGNGALAFTELASNQSRKIITLGGSFVFDVYQTDETAWPQQLQDNLNTTTNSSLMWEVLNAGIPGSNLTEIAGRVIFEISVLRPKIVIMSSMWNDLGLLRTKGPLLDLKRTEFNPYIDYMNEFDQVGCKLSFAYTWMRYLYLTRVFQSRNFEGMQMMSSQFDHERAKADAPSEVALIQYQHLWKTLILSIKAIGAIPVVLVEPVRDLNAMVDHGRISGSIDFDEDYTQNGIIRSLHEELGIQRALAAEGAVVLDYTQYFKDHPGLLADHVHLNRKGATEFARRLSKDISARIP